MRNTNRAVIAVAGLFSCVLWGATAVAQDPESGDVQLTAQTRIGKKADKGNDKGNKAKASAGGNAADSGVRLGVQVRVDAFNVIGAQTDLGGGTGEYSSAFTPIVTPGVRLLDQRLYVGLGLGFNGYNVDVGADAEQSRSAFSLAPMAMFDVLADDWGALSLGGWLTLSSVGDTETCDDDGCVTVDDSTFGWGLNLMAGLRGQLTPSLALGGELGWGFLDLSSDGDDDFFHGVLGLLVIEATLGI